jgi:predicted secreted protein
LPDNHLVDIAPMPGLNWYWISVAGALPFLLAMLVAYPFWRRSEAIFGNIIATAVIFAFSFGMIWREHIELDAIVKVCLDAGTVCWPEPAAFTRFAIYAFIGLVQVFIVFTLSLRVEERVRRRDYAPEWR